MVRVGLSAGLESHQVLQVTVHAGNRYRLAVDIYIVLTTMNTHVVVQGSDLVTVRRIGRVPAVHAVRAVELRGPQRALVVRAAKLERETAIKVRIYAAVDLLRLRRLLYRSSH